jgi:hypothetical protein
MEFSAILDKKNQYISELKSTCESHSQKIEETAENHNINDPSLHQFYESLHESFRERERL